jgi:hypothetical protein
MRKILIGFMVVLVIIAAIYFRFRHAAGAREVAYAGNREVTLWSTTAQVREAVATVKYGERLDVLGRTEDQVRVRTADGFIGWTNEADLLTADLWQRANDLEAAAAKAPIEAHGHTQAISNLHVEAGRDTPRIRQLNKGVPVDLFQRRVVEMPTSLVAARAPAVAVEKTASTESPTNASADAGPDAQATPTPAVRREDWWLVRAHLPDQTSVAGWILSRFIDLDVPAPLPDYSSAAAMHIVAWFELNHVMDAAGESKPQYLVVGNRGPEGQACDFTMIRVFTWGKRRQRYETAYVESDVCGKLPMKLMPAAAGGDLMFSFEDLSHVIPEERRYRMDGTIVRHLREGGSEPVKKKHARG